MNRRTSLAALLALALPASAQAAITHHHTAAGQALARRLLIARSDLGRSWKQQSAASSKVQFLTCSVFNPKTPSATEIGGADSPTYARSPSGPFLQQTAWVYSTPAQESGVWTRVVRPSLVRCLAASVRGSSGGGAKAAIKHMGSLPSLALGLPNAGYRVRGTLTVSDQTVDIYVDMLVLGHGRAMSSLVISTFEQPVARQLELRLAHAAARHLHLG